MIKHYFSLYYPLTHRGAPAVTPSSQHRTQTQRSVAALCVTVLLCLNTVIAEHLHNQPRCLKDPLILPLADPCVVILLHCAFFFV